MQIAKTKTVDEANGKWFGILTALGVDEKFLKNKHGPCVICGGHDRWRWDNRDGNGSWFCTHDGSGSGMDLLMKLHGWTFAQAAKEVDRVVGTIQPGPIVKVQNEDSKVKYLRETWKASKPIMKDDPAWLYLSSRIGIDVMPQDLRYHPSLRYTDDDGVITTHPAMLALMRYSDGRAASIHRTYLTENGKKADVVQSKKMMPGRPLNGASVWLGPIAEHIGVAEGIESALAATKLFDVPTWAATNSGLMETWISPPGIKKVTIFGDCDSSYAGQVSAYKLASRLAKIGIQVDVKIPEKIDSDWCDCIR